METSEAVRSVTQAARGIRQAGIVLAAVARPVAFAVRELADTVYDGIERAYLEEHGSLPGSERTRRLRKKRRDAVLRWWRSTMEV